MDLTLVLSAVIFTLLAVVVATSLLSADSSGPPRRLPGSERAEPRLNGHVPERRKKKEEEEEKKKKEEEGEDWCEISGSSHDHWDVVKSVLSEEAHPHLHTEGVAAPVEPSSSTPVSLEVDPPSRASSGRGRRSFIGLSEKELLKCAFSYPQTEGATESPDIDDKADSLKYVPGKARSHHLQMMMSKEELEEEQRVQREQLAAIFQLLRDNKETFGEVSEGDMEEQLRLYSI